MAHEKIVTAFNTRHEAEAAKRNLEKAGFSDNDISLIMGEDLKTEGEEIRHPSIWKRLFGDTVEADDAAAYMHAIDVGGVVLTVRADEDKVDRAMSILNMHDSIDTSNVALGRSTDVDMIMDDNVTTPGVGEAVATERRYTTPTDKVEVDEVQVDRVADVDHVTDADYVTDADRDMRRDPITDRETDVETLRLAEEQLEVGKRVVAEGSTRVRRYVTQKDVEAEVTLREEHADIFRRAIHDGPDLNDVDWSDKVVEITETREQPVINKTARVVEEVVVRKGVTDHVEKVNDTVRRQEVEIDRVNTNGDPVDDTAIEPYNPDKR